MHNVRRRVLYQSVQPLLPEGAQLVGAVSVWTMTLRGLALTATGGVVAFAMFWAFVTATTTARLVWSILIAVLLGFVFADSRVVALTDQGFVMLSGSPIRNVATKLLGRLADGSAPVKLGGNLATSDWSIDGDTFSVSKRGEKELERLLAYNTGRS